MRFISRKFHAVLDYIVGILLIAAPWLLGFADVEPAMWVPVIIGIAIIGMSIFTDYEGGAVKAIPMGAHLTMDVIAGLILAASPWLFGFADQVFWPHLIVGILEVGAGLFTVSASQHSRTNNHRSELRGAH
ncbi:SPW repeat protein [Parapedobacter deserti]|uniref:SPW repeat protein n=1 Tax=Parapedobacter deserti TaxID=1912957 RepID=A0ABV7JU92_9SPHI